MVYYDFLDALSYVGGFVPLFQIIITKTGAFVSFYNQKKLIIKKLYFRKIPNSLSGRFKFISYRNRFAFSKFQKLKPYGWWQMLELRNCFKIRKHQVKCSQRLEADLNPVHILD